MKDKYKYHPFQTDKMGAIAGVSSAAWTCSIFEMAQPKGMSQA
jgi:hypothetical protein